MSSYQLSAFSPPKRFFITKVLYYLPSALLLAICQYFSHRLYLVLCLLIYALFHLCALLSKCFTIHVLHYFCI